MQIKNILSSAIFKKIIIIAIILLAIILLLIWYILPNKQLNVLIVDKTIDQTNLDYAFRKHKGITWLLQNKKYVKNDGSTYTDEDFYSGIDNIDAIYNDNTDIQTVQLSKQEIIPDVIYLSDAYGIYENNELGEAPISGGITSQELSLILNAQANGSTIIGEYNIAEEPTKDNVMESMQKMFGLEFTHWYGKYFLDLSSDEVPIWFHHNYEQNFGEKWEFEGPGIILASSTNEIVVLEEGEDYDTDLPITIHINDDFRREFNAQDVGYYNWFEIVEADSSSEVIANYKLDLNDSGLKKLSNYNIESNIPAIIRQSELGEKSYYFAGDFTDYTGPDRTTKSILAQSLFSAFSIERPGDTTNFYWRFYLPLVSQIFDNTYKSSDVSHINERILPKDININASKYYNNDIMPIGIHVDGVLPGNTTDIINDSYIYRDWFAEISDMGLTSIRVSKLMPSAFYSALEEYNVLHPENPLYLMQGIDYNPDDYNLLNTNTGIDNYNIQMNDVIDALNGNLNDDTKNIHYYSDISDYVSSININLSLDNDRLWATNQASTPIYSGQYFSSSQDASPSEIFAAMTLDETTKYTNEQYGDKYAMSLNIPQIYSTGTQWGTTYTDGMTFNTNNIDKKDTIDFFITMELAINDEIYSDIVDISSYLDSDNTANNKENSISFKDYAKEYLNNNQKYPIIIDALGLPTNMNVLDSITSTSGLSENEQGEVLTKMLDDLQDCGFRGVYLYTWHDEWSEDSDEYKPFIMSDTSNLWHNVMDPAQNYGILSVESKENNELPFLLSDIYGIMNNMTIHSDETFLYITVDMNSQINFDEQTLIIGLDTYGRNDGEYLYNKNLFATALSGMEYIIKFSAEDDAELLVAPQYDKNNGGLATLPSYAGEYDFISTLKYGNFEESNTQIFKADNVYYMRIPWALLNFVDPANQMVVDDTENSTVDIDEDKQLYNLDVLPGEDYGANSYVEPIYYGEDVDFANKYKDMNIGTTATDGIIFSLLISDLATMDTEYNFPMTKESSGYRRYTWLSWSEPKYDTRLKDSYTILQNYLTKRDGDEN